jgi:hypothetical protein
VESLEVVSKPPLPCRISAFIAASQRRRLDTACRILAAGFRIRRIRAEWMEQQLKLLTDKNGKLRPDVDLDKVIDTAPVVSLDGVIEVGITMRIASVMEIKLAARIAPAEEKK